MKNYWLDRKQQLDKDFWIPIRSSKERRVFYIDLKDVVNADVFLMKLRKQFQEGRNAKVSQEAGGH